jgi:DNA primase
VSLGPGFDAKEQVRQAVDIVDLVGSYVQLRRQGRNFVGLCPWHDDSRPSFQVNPERQSFKCWVCDIGGDVFSFVMKTEGLEFREALEMLAERAGIQLQPSPRVVGSGDKSGGTADKRTLLRLMAWAEEQFHRCLVAGPEAAAARQYVAERGISDETIRQFHLGFSPESWDWLATRARGTEWTSAMLEKVGLLVSRDTAGGYYDRFRGRVIFSIRDGRSRPIAFGGRVLPQLASDRMAKYVNSPETPLFSKSRELYGLDVARDGIARAHSVVVMEGYTDCIMAHQHGLDNVVAVLGTALGEHHVQLLRRYTDSITLVLDGDEAGRRRTNEIIDSLLALFVKNQIDLRILTLPEGIDPCDFIATQGSDSFRRLLSEAVDALEHKFRTVTNGLAISTDTHRASQAVEQVLATLAQMRTASAEASSAVLLREQQMLGRVAREFRLPEEQLRTRLVALRRDARHRQPASQAGSPAAAPQSPHKLADLAACDRLLLELVLLDPAYVARIEPEISVEEIETPVARQIYDACLQLAHASQEPDFQHLLSHFDDEHIKSLLVHLDESCAARPTAEPERMLQDLLAAFERRRRDQQLRTALAEGRTDEQSAVAELEKLRQETRPDQLRMLEQRRN